MSPCMIDLHMHTTFSDGSITPEALVAMAIENGLKAVAITDHDNTYSYKDAVEAAKGTDLEIIPGIEINTWWKKEHKEYEVHVLGYYIDPENEYIQRVCKEHNCSREQQMSHFVNLMQKHGKVPITFEDIQSFSRPGGTIGRPHVAKAIVDKGGAANISDAFRKYLVPTAPTYHRRATVTPHEAVEAIYESGGIAVIAHPGDMDIIEELATELMNYGLRGIEAYHRSHSPAEIEFHCSLAERLGLIVTGGTDFHGTVELYPNSLGRLHLPDWVYEELKKEKRRIDLQSVKSA
jgi:3',5'-nucleoside bisphosphate phosphatase